VRTPSAKPGAASGDVPPATRTTATESGRTSGDRKPLPNFGTFPPPDIASEFSPTASTSADESAFELHDSVRTQAAPQPPRHVSTDSLLQQAGVKPRLPEEDFGLIEDGADGSTSGAAQSGVHNAEHTNTTEPVSPHANETETLQQEVQTADIPAGPPAEPQILPPSPDRAVSPNLPLAAISQAGSGPQTPSVTLEWIRQTELNVGQECECHLVIRNSGTIAARDVAIDAHFPATVQVNAVMPRPNGSNEHFTWNFETLAAGAEEIIRMRIVPATRGDLEIASSVRFTGDAAARFQVAEPMLEVSITGPKEVLMGDPASQIILVSNPGTGTANNVKIESLIPAGLEHPRGDRLVMEIGSLNPGESRSVRLGLAAVEGGQHAVQVSATAGASLAQTATADIHVIAPSLKIALDGPSLRYIGRSAKYLLTVTNDGSAATHNIRVMHQVPDGFQFAGADNGGKFDPATATASWFVSQHEPQQSTQLAVELLPVKVGNYVQIAGVVTELGTRASTELPTEVDGTASLVLEIADRNDPVEVGAETAYEVRVRNEGSIAAQNVALSCELPEGVQFIEAKGPVEGSSEDGLVIFQTVEQLESGATATFLIHVKGSVEGNHRFRARLASDSIQEPLIFEELTKFYGG
jgi:uncharacterized repeat protein (TIGR01451 family)